jgi:hypothetical protein
MTTLDTRHAASLRVLLARRPVLGNAGPSEHFVVQYIYFEALLRIALHAYAARDGASELSKGKKTEVRKDVVLRTLEHFEVSLSRENIEKLLDSKSTKRDSKSARVLRNALVHEWKAEDAAEVGRRLKELLGLFAEAIAALSALAERPATLERNSAA